MGNATSDTDEPLVNISETVSSYCSERVSEIQWNRVSTAASVTVLGLINIMVVIGNTLVIMAVFFTSKLRTVTNFFIVSLAVADLMVGIAVLPFSTAYEILGFWVFGNIWCQTWLAVDVWMCTASILNLCAISLDRYVAVTRPISYPSIMSSKRVKILIALVWCVSFVICLPPLVGWRDSQKEPSSIASLTTINTAEDETTDQTSATMSVVAGTQRRSLTFPNHGVQPFLVDQSKFDNILQNFSEHARTKVVRDTSRDKSENFSENLSGTITPPFTQVPPQNSSVRCTCELISDKGYRIYSALGSFYIPMLVMLFFYWRIYRAAIETTRAINQGFRTTKSGSSTGGRFDEQRLTLRIHRGRSSTDLYGKSNGTTCDSANVQIKGGSRRIRNSSFKELPSQMDRVVGATFPPSSDHKMRKLHLSRQRTASGNASKNASGQATVKPTTTRRKALRHHWMSVSCSLSGNVTTTTTTTTPSMSTPASLPSPQDKVDRERDTNVSEPTSIQLKEIGEKANGKAQTDEDDKKGSQLFPKMGKRNIKAQVKRFRTETKAAKTLGIIVGGFILCWLPFFTIYLIGAFCVDDCISESLFSVFFWLGYCNSAINPCVYALFSRDFRHAFKRILCRCFMRKEHSIKERIVTMFPANLHLASFFEESEDGSNSH